jgi:L-fuconolactonase
MKIDSHHHLWDLSLRPYDWITGDAMLPIKRNFDVSDLHRALEGTGIERTIAVQASTTFDETFELLALADQLPTIVGVVGWLPIDSNNAIEECEKYLTATGASYLKGIRDIAQDHPDPNYLSRPQSIKNVQQLGKLDLTYDILTKTPELRAGIELVKACPDVQFVLDHISKPYISREETEPWKSLISELSSFENVSCKVSGLVTEANWKSWKVEDFRPYVDHIIECFGAERIMYGSDWPVALLATSKYCDLVDLAEELTSQLSESEKEFFWRENAKSAYKITSL